jgi:hypothetical protein
MQDIPDHLEEESEAVQYSGFPKVLTKECMQSNTLGEGHHPYPVGSID